jgi:membrane protease YdiL (CAAX protease family)
MKKQTLRTTVIVLIFFLTYYIGSMYFGVIKSNLDKLTQFGLASYVITYFIIGLPIFLGTYLISNKQSILKSLGLQSNILRAFVIAGIFALPMFIGGAVFSKPERNIEIEDAVAGTICAGFFEELYFRGFFFGQLFKHTRLGFITSILLGAIVFASGHLYQSQNFSETIGIFAVTFMGSVFFAWLYTEWNYNLWVPIWLHTLMNASWMLFRMDDTALGNTTSNIFRGVTIALAIMFTIIYKRKKGQHFLINKRTLLIKSDAN